jgi:hypothetical protein
MVHYSSIYSQLESIVFKSPIYLYTFEIYADKGDKVNALLYLQ